MPGLDKDFTETISRGTEYNTADAREKSLLKTTSVQIPVDLIKTLSQPATRNAADSRYQQTAGLLTMFMEAHLRLSRATTAAAAKTPTTTTAPARTYYTSVTTILRIPTVLRRSARLLLS
jgi:hypothetical protein